MTSPCPAQDLLTRDPEVDLCGGVEVAQAAIRCSAPIAIRQRIQEHATVERRRPDHLSSTLRTFRARSAMLKGFAKNWTLASRTPLWTTAFRV